MSLRYREYTPTAPASRFVECFWTLELDADGARSAPERIVPDGRVEWIAHMGDAVREHGKRDDTRIQPSRMVVGARDNAMVIEPLGTLRCFGIRFHPAGARSFLRAEHGELFDRTAASDDVAPHLDRALASRLDPGDPPERWVAHAEAALSEIDANAPDPLAVAASDAILAAHGRISIDGLARRLGVSRRTLERRFDREVGLTPKRLARVVRFQRVFHWTREGAVDWSAVALACGYSDQAHLIRDFRELAGETPAALVASERELTDTFTRRVSHSSNPVA